MEELKPLIGETVEQFMYRLSDNKNELNLSWKDISILICTNFGRKVSSDYVRHEYYAMKKRDKIEVDKEEGYTKVMVVNDLHVPYHREDFFNELEKIKI
jgi:hypothetical protein